MENNTTNQDQSQIIQQTQLPNSSGVLVMGILSLVSFCCVATGILSLVLGILALVQGNNALKLYNLNPSLYTDKSLKNTKAGRTCGIIGLCLGGLSIVGLLIYLSIVGWALGSILATMPWNMM